MCRDIECKRKCGIYILSAEREKNTFLQGTSFVRGGPIVLTKSVLGTNFGARED